jgi:hypothetical protein
MKERRIEIHQNVVNRLTDLPDLLEVSRLEAFPDGGTLALCGDLSTETVFRISLSPPSTVIYQGLPGRIDVYLWDKSGRERIFEVVARSDFEAQVINALKSATYKNERLEQVRDKIISFVESERYVELYREGELMSPIDPIIQETPTPGVVFIDHKSLSDQ